MPTSAPTNALDTASSTVVLTSGSIFIDHTTIALARIPTEWLEAAKRDVVWLYSRTSHGSQLVTGANCLSERVKPQMFNFVTEWGAVPAQSDPLALRLADDDGWSLDPDELLAKVRGYLDDPAIGPHVTALMWSWCGEMSGASTPVDEYVGSQRGLGIT